MLLNKVKQNYSFKLELYYNNFKNKYLRNNLYITKIKELLYNLPIFLLIIFKLHNINKKLIFIYINEFKGFKVKKMLENFLNLEKKLMNYYIHNKFTLLDNTFFEILQKKNKKKYQQKEYSVSLLKNIQKLKHFR